MTQRSYPKPTLYLLRWRAEMMTGQEVWATAEAALRSYRQIMALLTASGETPFWVRIYGMSRGGMLVSLEELERRAPLPAFAGLGSQAVH